VSALRRWSRSAVLARVLVVLLPLVAVAAAGQRPATPFVVVLAVLAVAWAAAPESPVGWIVLVLVIGWWGVRVADPLQPTVLLAAAALLGAHVAALLASYGPARLSIGGPLALLWVRRTLLALLVVPVAWAAALGLDGAPDQPALWTVALVTVAGLVLATALALRQAAGDEP
jgi:hypothetical protein